MSPPDALALRGLVAFTLLRFGRVVEVRSASTFFGLTLSLTIEVIICLGLDFATKKLRTA